MDRKAVQKNLKDASDAIKAKDFPRADDLTSRILMFDGQNASALVFRGLCRENSRLFDEALKCYRLAVENKPDGLLGWQALESFYEKQDNEMYFSDLADVYLKLLALLSSNPTMKSKRQDTVTKHLDLLRRLRRFEEIEQMADEELGKIESVEAAFKTRLILEEVYSALDRREKLRDLQEHLIFKNQELFEDNARLTGIIDSYLKKLRKSDHDLGDLRKKCLDILLIRPEHKLANETIILIHLESLLISLHPRWSEFTEISSRIDRLSPEHSYRAIVECLQRWRGDQPVSALDLLQEKMESPSFTHWRVVYLLKAHLGMALHRVDVCRAAKSVPSQCESICPAEWITHSIQFAYWKCCSGSGDKLLIEHEYQEMKKELASLDGEPLEQQLLYCRLAILAGKFEESEQMLENLQVLTSGDDGDCLELDICRSILEYCKENYNEALECLNRECHSDYFESLVWMGKSKWQLEQYEDSLQDFQLAAKKDPRSWESHLYIGYFHEKRNNLPMAKTHYKNAFSIKKNALTGVALCDFLFKLKKYPKALKILDEVVGTTETNLKWAWFRKGNVHMALREASNAVFAYQKAVSFDIDDPLSYECLGDANSSRRSYETAIKNYREALRVDPSREYSQIRVADLLRISGQHFSAIEEYTKVLALESQNNRILGLKGIGDTYLSLAASSLKDRLVKLAVSQVEKSVFYLTQAVCLQPHFVSIIRSLADACVLLHEVSESYLSLNIPVTLLDGNFTDGFTEDTRAVDKEEMVRLATRLYSTALKLKKDLPDTWCCLGFSLLQLYRITNDRSAIAQAEVSVKQAIKLSHEESSYWNLLGVIFSTSKPAFFQAQHCFIQAVKLDSENALAWSNLGVLYLLDEKIELAHKVFSRSQCEDPALANPWLGQGRIAALMDQEKEAFDLFRHSSILGHTNFGALAYTRLLLQFILNVKDRDDKWYRNFIIKLNAFILASDMVEHSLELNPRCKELLHGFALLQDTLGNRRRAVSCIKKCFELDGGADANLHRNALRLIEFGEHSNSLDLPEDESDTVEKLCIRGYLLASRGDLDGASEAYERASDLAENPLDRSHISAAIAFHAFRAGDTEMASDSLFQSVQEEIVAPEAILGLSALSLLDEDTELDEELGSTLLDELGKMQSNPHAVYLHCLVLKELRGYADGLKHMQRAVFRRPHDTCLWNYLTRYILTRPDADNAATIAATCCQIALSLHPTSYAHARLLFEVYSRYGDHMDRQMERLVCRLYHLYPADDFACKSIATVAKRRIDHAERGAVSVLQRFSREMRDRQN